MKTFYGVHSTKLYPYSCFMRNMIYVYVIHIVLYFMFYTDFIIIIFFSLAI